jgi:predicted DNA-binding protein
MAVRTQIYLTEEQRARLAERGRRDGLAMAELIREAVDTYLASENDLEATFGAAPGIRKEIPSRAEWKDRG